MDTDKYQTRSPIEPASFSFQNSISQHTQQPMRSFSKCLRLKTNESLEGHNSNQLKKDVRKSMSKVQQSQIITEHCQRLAQEQYDLRTQSLIKQYQLRLSKQEEYYGLREWKMKQQIQNLQKQTIVLSEQLRRARLSQRQVSQKCTLCQDGQILSQYNKLITQNQEHHKNCLTQRKQLINKVEQITNKYQVLEEQHQKTCIEMRNQNKMIRSLRAKICQLQSQKNYASMKIDQLDHRWKQKAERLEYESKQLQKELMQKQNQVSQMNISKATVQSTQSVLTNPHFSINSSLIKQKYTRDQKQNIMIKPRGSLCKQSLIEQDSQPARTCLKKLSQNIPRTRTASVKNESLRWKRY